MSQSNEDRTIGIRKLLLDFYSSELTTHSRLIIGFSALLFTILQVVPKPIMGQSLSDTSASVALAMFGIWIVSGSLWFLLMRHISYGVLSNSTLHAEMPIPTDGSFSLHDALIAVRNDALHRNILVIFPSGLFISVDRTIEIRFLRCRVRHPWAWILGAALCYFVFGILTTLFLAKLVGLI